MANDLPDRTAGVDYPEGTTQRRLTQIGADVERRRRPGDRHTAELATRPQAARRPRRRGAAAGGPREHPIGAAAGTGRARAHPGAEAPPRGREVVGAQRICRDPADAVPARRSVRPVGVGARRPAPHHHARAQPARGRPARTGHHLAARAPGSAGPQRIPRGRRRRPVLDRAGGRADIGNACRRTDPDRPQAQRRRDRDARRVAAQPAAARRRWCWPACANPQVHGDPAARCTPPTRSRPCASSAAPRASS